MDENKTLEDKIDAFAATLNADEQAALAWLIAGDSDDVSGFAETPPWPGMPALLDRLGGSGFVDSKGRNFVDSKGRGTNFVDIVMGGTEV